MGTFQAVASGLGEAGEQAGQGYNQALNEALKYRQQAFMEKQAGVQSDFQNRQLDQSYKLAQQQHDLFHQQMVAQGWDAGVVTKDPNTGKYMRTYTNKQTGEQRTLPEVGNPPDSAEAHLETYKMLKEQGWDDNKAMQAAFKVGNLYRTDPVGMAQEWQDRAKQLFEDKGVKSVPIIGYGKVDISTPAGQANYAQIMVDGNTRSAAAMARAMYGNGAGVANGRNMDGFTADEAREFKAYEESLKGMGGLRERLAVANINNTLDSTERKELTESTIKQQQADEDKLNSKYNEIGSRRAWSVSAFMNANPTATSAQIGQAKQQAARAHKRIVP